MSYPFSKLFGLDSKAAGKIAVDVINEMVTAGTDSFVTDFSVVLKERLAVLGKSLAQSRQVQLTAEAAELLREVKREYVDLRSVLRGHSHARSLKEVAAISGELYDMLERHGGAIEKLPRHAMLTALENIDLEIDGDTTKLELAGVLPIYIALMDLCKLWVEKEKERDETALDEGSVPNETEASQQLNSTVRSIYKHIEGYAGIDKEGYGDLLEEFDMKLAPIFIHIKSNETRHQHEIEEKSLEAAE